MTALAQNLQTETVVLLPVAECHKSPSQPRKRGGDKPDDDFVDSIRQKGVIQPIVVRVRKAGGWEIVFGHRRHRGSTLAERETIPAIVRDLTDEDVFEAQLIENIHREDMHPLDEADGFKRMIEKGQKTVQQIAERIGRPVTYVAQRLKLCELGSQVRTALDKDEITLGVAVLLARVPGALQAEALKSLWHGMGAAEAKRRLEETYLMRLDQAPFDIASAELVPKAGACSVCPKRTGQQRELFADVKSPDLCIDRVCYRGKLDAVWQIRVKEAKASGQKILDGKAAQELTQGFSREWRNLDDKEWIGSSQKEVRAILGKDLPPIALARDNRSGAILELVKRADVEKAMRRNRPARENGSGDGDRWQAQQKREAAKAQLRALAVDEAMAEAVKNIHGLGDAGLIRLVTRALVESCWDESHKQVLIRRGLEPKGKKYDGAELALVEYVKTSKAVDVAGLALELALRSFGPSRYKSADGPWAETLKDLGVRFDAIEKKVAAEAKAKKTAKKGGKRAVKKAA